jgi:hypothetical protein
MPVSSVGLGAVDDVIIDDVAWYDFVGKWNVVKNYKADMEGVWGIISLKIQQLNEIKLMLVESGDHIIAAMLQPEIDVIEADLEKWWTNKEYIDTYWDLWSSVAGATGLGFALPVIAGGWWAAIGVAGLIALGYVATEGMSLLAKYRIQTHVLDQVSTGALSPSEAQRIIEKAPLTTNGGVLAGIGEGFSGLLGNIPMYAAIAVVGYFILMQWSKKS